MVGSCSTIALGAASPFCRARSPQPISESETPRGIGSRHLQRSAPVPRGVPLKQATASRLQRFRRPAADERRINLDAAASSFAKGVNAGADADDLAAQQLGAATAAQLTEVQQRYKDKVKAALEQRAEELKKEKERRAVKFTQGKLAYERGWYPQSAALLEGALNEEGPFSQVGGEIQMWLALAYQACGREEDCVEMYRTLEKTHPIPSIRRQAANLRYIIEAPKLEISPDEKVQIPVLTDLDLNRGNRQQVAPRPRPTPAQAKRPKSWDEEYWANYTAPVYLTNRYVWVAALVLAAGLAWYSSNVQQ